ncbi:MAG: FAD-dependent monooxygenase [Pyrinomonadaceae bacterium]
MQTDVLIVGAGPTGLALACQLIRHGVDFVIIDKKETTTPHSRAIGVQARTLEIYEQMGLAAPLIELGEPAEKVRMIAGGEVRGEAILKDIGKGLSPYPFLLIVEQGKHERLLYDHIRENDRDVLWQTDMTELSQDGNGVTAEVVRSDGAVNTITAKYLVGCDGASSRVRHQLGLTFEGDTVGRLFYVADVQIDWEFDHDALHVCLAEQTITAFFPMVGAKRWRIVGTFPEGHEKDEGEILYEEIERQIELDTELDLDISNVNWFSVYKVHSRAANSFSKGRCFIAGDAAHIHTPAGAQGMNTGIQDGYNLAWKLALICRHAGQNDLLSTYNEERLPNALRLLATTDRFFRLGATDEWFISFVRTHVFPYVLGFALSLDVVKNAIFPLVSQIGISYAGSSLSKQKGDFEVKAGDRMPWSEIDGKSIYDQLRAPNFHLLFFLDRTTEVPSLPAKLMDQWSVLIDTHVFEQSSTVANAFGTFASFYVILRPDNYIGLISDDFSPEIVAEYLAKYLKG